MDVTVEIPHERLFTIQLRFFDTVLNMKEKIQQQEGFPVSRQTLVVNDEIMVDDRDAMVYGVFVGSLVFLLLEPEPIIALEPTIYPDPTMKFSASEMQAVIEEFQPPAHLLEPDHRIAPEPTIDQHPIPKISELEIQAIIETFPPPAQYVILVITLPLPKRYTVTMDVNNTVFQLKEKISQTEGLHPNSFVLSLTDFELLDHLPLQDYGISDFAEINVVMKDLLPSATATEKSKGKEKAATAKASGSGSEKMMIMVVPWKSSRKIELEVNPSDEVGVLRRELRRLQQFMDFVLPSEYFFIHKQQQETMDEEGSFRWHGVRPGDTIEVFIGYVGLHDNH